MESSNPQEPKQEYNERTAVLVKDLVIAIARTPEGPAIMSDFNSRQEMVNSMVNLNLEISGKIFAHDLKQKQSGIIQPPGGIMSFARKVFKR